MKYLFSVYCLNLYALILQMIDEQLLSDDLLYVKGRYETFKNWPFNENANCSPIKVRIG